MSQTLSASAPIAGEFKTAVQTALATAQTLIETQAAALKLRCVWDTVNMWVDNDAVSTMNGVVVYKATVLTVQVMAVTK